MGHDSLVLNVVERMLWAVLRVWQRRAFQEADQICRQLGGSGAKTTFRRAEETLGGAPALLTLVTGHSCNVERVVKKQKKKVEKVSSFYQSLRPVGNERQGFHSLDPLRGDRDGRDGDGDCERRNR